MPKKKSADKPAASIDKVTARKIAACEAKAKQLRGDKLTRKEQRDVVWYETERTAIAIEQWTAAVPKGDYCRLTGRQHKLIADAARNYALPLDGPTIDLAATLTALHDLIADNAHRIRGQDVDGDRVELEDEKLRAQIAKLRTENDKLSVQLQRERGDSIQVAELRNALTGLAAAMRQHGRAFQSISPSAGKLWNKVMKQLADEIESGALAF